MSRVPEGSDPRRNDGPSHARRLRRWWVIGVAAIAFVVLAIPLRLAVREAWSPRLAPPTAPQYVGSKRCRPCHQDQYDAWKGSNHARAMQPADDVTGPPGSPVRFE